MLNDLDFTDDPGDYGINFLWPDVETCPSSVQVLESENVFYCVQLNKWIGVKGVLAVEEVEV